MMPTPPLHLSLLEYGLIPFSHHRNDSTVIHIANQKRPHSFLSDLVHSKLGRALRPPNEPHSLAGLASPYSR